MEKISQSRVVETDDLRLLAYIQHMAQTARSDSARRAFELFLQQERQRLETGGGFDSLRPSEEASRAAVDSPDRASWRNKNRLPNDQTVY